MRTIISITEFHELAKRPVALAAGFFDGVHRGHQAVIASAVKAAADSGGQAWVLTFDRHPMEVVAPAKLPRLLSTQTLRARLLEQTGVEGCLMLPFTPELAACEAREFIEELCAAGNIASFHAGRNWRFGHGGAGSLELLAEMGTTLGFATEVVAPVLYDGGTISSTRIRMALDRGLIGEAAAMLGRPYILRGKVISGRGLGRTMGIATANIQPAKELLPMLGVYAVWVDFGGRHIQGAASIGWRPTFPDARPDSPLMEVHLLDFQGDIYGETMDVAFIARLRDEVAFEDKGALMRQVDEDIVHVRSLLANPPF